MTTPALRLLRALVEALPAIEARERAEAERQARRLELDQQEARARSHHEVERYRVARDSYQAESAAKACTGHRADGEVYQVEGRARVEVCRCGVRRLPGGCWYVIYPEVMP